MTLRPEDQRPGRSLDDLDRINASLQQYKLSQTLPTSSHNLVASPSSSSILSSNATISRHEQPNNAATRQVMLDQRHQQAPPSRSQGVFETSFVGKEPKQSQQQQQQQQPTVTTRLSAVPCYYRTLPDNKIQVMYPDSNQVFQFSYSKTVPPISKKSSMQLIQQVQPDGKLSEEKLYFFDPVQLDEADTRLRYHEQIMNPGKSPKKYVSGTPSKKQPWLFKKTIQVKEKMKQNKNNRSDLTS